jgi:AraC-like DNA-binding protein
MKSAQGRSLAPTFSSDVAHVITFHLLCEGTAYAEFESKRTELIAGDLISLPHGDAFMLGAGTSSNPLDSAAVFASSVENNITTFRAGGTGPRSRFICGFLACDRMIAETIIAGLPRLLRVNLRNDSSGRWLESSLAFAVAESAKRKAGTTAMVTKLSEAAFVETLRRYLLHLPPGQTGWLAGARDPVVGNALRLIHREPAYQWTLASLAQKSGTSRTALATRFRRFLGESPIAYLTRWRLVLGARSLAGSSSGVAQIAADVGYKSEAAFNRAFKRVYGLPPARYRRDKTLDRR